MNRTIDSEFTRTDIARISENYIIDHQLRLQAESNLVLLTDDGIVTSLDNKRNSDLDETRQEIDVVGQND